MENRRGSGIFLSVIGVATLIVAIIGATFAYFSANAASNNEAIKVGSTELELGYADVLDGLKTNMIPSEESIAEFAAFNEDWVAGEEIEVETEWDAEGNPTKTETITAPGQCIDQNGNEICSVYEFYVGNPSKTTNMDIVASLTVAQNDFENLKYAIYDESGDVVVEPVKFPDAGDTANLTALTQTLTAFDGVESRTGVKDFTTLGPENGVLAFDSEDPSTYQPSIDKSDPDNASALVNVRHYTMLIWIDEIESDQTDADAGAIFAAGITIKTGGASGGVTGVIAVANNA